MNPSDILFRYCDLTTANYETLCSASNNGAKDIHPKTRKAMADMLDRNEHITPYGEEVLARAKKLLSIGNDSAIARSNPIETTLSPQVIVNKVRRLMDIGVISPSWKVASVHIKVLFTLYNFPGQSFRFLCAIYGLSAIHDLLNADWITGVEMRGYPFHITDKGIEVVNILSGLLKAGEDNRSAKERSH